MVIYWICGRYWYYSQKLYNFQCINSRTSNNPDFIFFMYKFIKTNDSILLSKISVIVHKSFAHPPQVARFSQNSLALSRTTYCDSHAFAPKELLVLYISARRICRRLYSYHPE